MESDYNHELDILTVEEPDASDYAESLERGGFVLDLDNDSHFLGIEILDASQKTDLSQDELDNIHAARVDFERTDNRLQIDLTLLLDGEEHVISKVYRRKAPA